VKFLVLPFVGVLFTITLLLLLVVILPPLDEEFTVEVLDGRAAALLRELPVCTDDPLKSLPPLTTFLLE